MPCLYPNKCPATWEVPGKRHHLPAGFDPANDISKAVCCGGIQLPAGAKIYINKTVVVSDASRIFLLSELLLLGLDLDSFEDINIWNAKHLSLRLAPGKFGSLCFTISAISTEQTVCFILCDEKNFTYD